MNLIVEAFQYSFIQRALLTGSFIAICCAFLGVFLVLRRFSLIGDGLAHVSFATIALGLLLQTSPLMISIPLVMIASLLIIKLTEKAHIFGDAAIGLVSALGIAGGVLIASMAGGFNVDLFGYLFGSILSISGVEVWLSVALSAVVIFLVVFFYQDLFLITFDEEFARVSGLNVKRLNTLLILLTSLTIVLGVKVVGTMLVSSLIIFPSVSALQIARSFKAVIAAALLFAVLSVVFGVLIAFVANWPAGATIVFVNFLFFCLAFCAKSFIK